MTTKRAIGYVRISTKDQSNFSLDGQEEYIIKFCERQNWQLLTIFKDDGQSAKNFDRPDWKDLENFVKRNHANVDYLIVSKYDRFSRNVSEALQMIEMLEQRYNIRVMSVMEPIMLHPSSPYFFQFRTQMLLGAQVEWMVIRDRTKAGNHHAAKSGRYINMAPFGYKNARDNRNKPILVLDEDKAKLVREIFERFLSGSNMAQLKTYAFANGFRNSGKSAIQRLLSNPTYCGLIRVPEYYDEAEKMVKGIHEAIVSEYAWWKVQGILNNKSITQRTIMNDTVPMRGKLKCFCGRPLTAGKSKGKKIHVWYYRCNSHSKFNFNAKKVHAQFDEILKELSLPTTHIEYLKEIIEKNLDLKAESRDCQLKSLQSQLVDLAIKIDSLEVKFLQDDIDRDTFKKWKSKYHTQQFEIELTIKEISHSSPNAPGEYKRALSRLGDIQYLYTMATTEQKQGIISWVFNNSLSYQEGIYRTPFIQPLFASKAASLHEKRLLVYEQPLQKTPEITQCTRDGS